MAPTYPSEQEGVIVKEDIKTKEPPMFRVILCNDDYTTMDFVVHVLEAVFKKKAEEATQIMLQVHRAGKGTAGVYTREVAETKITIVHHLARKNEYPLRCAMEPA